MFAVIYIPDFLLQAALRPEPDLHSRPVALVEGTAARPVISELTQAASDQGVSVGMTPTQALARCPQLIIKNRSAAQEAAAAKALLDCAYGFSPFIEATADGICTIDLKGNSISIRNTSYAIDSLHAWAGKILSHLLNLNLAAQIGIGRTPLLALHAARAARPVQIVENAADFLADLPIESIEPPPEILGILKKWGIETLGAFTALGKDHLAERLGAEAVELFERATADATRPLRLVEPPEQFEEAMDFDHEIETAQPLLFVLRRFLEQIALRLELIYLVAEEIKLRLIFTHGPDHERVFKIPTATRKVTTLFRIVDTYLETLRTEHPIVGLRLSVRPCRPSHQQFSLFESALRDPNQFYETLGRLTGLVGSDRVGVPVVEPTYRPDSFHLRPVNFDFGAGSNRRKEVADLRTSSAKDQQPPHVGCYNLALRRLRPPLPAQVRVKDNIPEALKTEIFNRRIIAAQGPWKSSGDWWDRQPWSREEWDVETPDGELYRLCHQHGQWFVEAIYD